MRALETGRYMLRATNTGITAIIDERGRIVQPRPQFVTAALDGPAQGYTGRTPYVVWGNWPFSRAWSPRALLGAAMKLACVARRRKDPGTHSKIRAFRS